MLRFSRIPALSPSVARTISVCILVPGLFSAAAHAAAAKARPPEPLQETGFLNRKLEMHGATYRFQVYLPEEWRRDDHKQWPIILALHGRGERGTEGMWQTQIGLPQEVRDHPERWPFIIVMPQCPQASYWTDPEMQAMALATLDQETAEFHADLDRTYLSGLSLGGYGAWELARSHPHRFAAITIISSGVFWTYAPERWSQAATLPAEYARALGRTPIWLFHGSDDNVVAPRESELMFEAFKANGGHIRLWVYQGLRHDSWTRAYNEPELPRWLLAHHGSSRPGTRPGTGAGTGPDLPPLAERLVVPLHPPAIKLTTAQLDSFVGEYRDINGHPAVTVFRQGDQLYEKNHLGEIDELAAESPSAFFYPNGATVIRILIERDPQGRVTALVYHDDRHEERWERHIQSASR